MERGKRKGSDHWTLFGKMVLWTLGCNAPSPSRQGSRLAMDSLPSSCSELGNETAHTLAKKGTTKGQKDRSTTFQVTKTIIKAAQHSKCMAATASTLQQIRPLATICCQDQRRCLSVSICGWATAVWNTTSLQILELLSHLKHHLFTNVRTAQSELCPYLTGSVLTELLPTSQLHESVLAGGDSADEEAFR